MNTINSEAAPAYVSATPKLDDVHDKLIAQAINILRGRLRTPGTALNSPNAVRQYLTLQLAGCEEEHFSMLLLDNQHRVIHFADLFRGTLDGASVYSREVVKLALSHNAAAVIFSHNHPSGVAEPSDADIKLTRKLKDALALVDIRVLDHIIVGGCSEMTTVSFAERGIL